MNDSLQEQPFLAHLLELRDRLLRMVLAVLVLLLAILPFSTRIFEFLAKPMINALPAGGTMLATQVLSPVLTPLKLAFVTAVFLAVPYLLSQIWGFIAPGLYRHEKRLAVPLLVSSVVLFYLGTAFAYFVILPILFPFLVGMVPAHVQAAPDIADFLNLAIRLFFAFGMAFEVPIAIILVVLSGAVKPETFTAKRPYIIVGAFVVAMLLTPPDVISQTLLAVPLLLLFESGLFVARILVRKRGTAEPEAVAAGGTGNTTGFDVPPDPDDDPQGPDDDPRGPDGAATADEQPAADAAEPEDDDEPYRPLSEEEMDAELDRIEAEESASATGPAEMVDPADETDRQPGAVDAEDAPRAAPPAFEPDAVDAKLEQVMALRERGELEHARNLLYEVLVEGNNTQVTVARSILSQLDA